MLTTFYWRFGLRSRIILIVPKDEFDHSLHPTSARQKARRPGSEKAGKQKMLLPTRHIHCKCSTVSEYIMRKPFPDSGAWPYPTGACQSRQLRVPANYYQTLSYHLPGNWIRCFYLWNNPWPSQWGCNFKATVVVAILKSYPRACALFPGCPKHFRMDNLIYGNQVLSCLSQILKNAFAFIILIPWYSPTSNRWRSPETM